MIYARTENGIVAQVLRVHPSTIYEPAYAAQFIEAPNEVQRGWLWNGSIFSAPPPPEPPSAHDLEEIKRKLIAEGVVKRDFLLMHLRWFYTKANEEAAAAVGQPAIDAAIAKRNAINTAINSLQNIFNDPRIVAAINGDVKVAADQVKGEIGAALYAASPETYLALKALDPL